MPNRPAREGRGGAKGPGRGDRRGPTDRSRARTTRPRPSKEPARSASDADDEPDDEPDDGLVRLNKYLASHGVASRRGCDRLIEDGGVMIDGEIVSDLGTKVDPAAQRIEVDGVILKPEGVRHRYYLLNKPSGVVCTNDVRESKPRAVDLIHDKKKGRIYTVGRLDEETIGLVILTNDGDFAHRVMHPRHGVSKTYLVKVLGKIDDAALRKLREGIWLDGGRTGGSRILVQKRSPKYSRLEVTLREGKNREVRRMFAKQGFKVVDLKRVRIGHLGDRGLKVGAWRPLTRGEVAELVELSEPGAEERAERSDAPRGRRGGARRRPRD